MTAGLPDSRTSLVLEAGKPAVIDHRYTKFSDGLSYQRELIVRVRAMPRVRVRKVERRVVDLRRIVVDVVLRFGGFAFTPDRRALERPKACFLERALFFVRRTCRIGCVKAPIIMVDVDFRRRGAFRAR